MSKICNEYIQVLEKYPHHSKSQTRYQLLYNYIVTFVYIVTHLLAPANINGDIVSSAPLSTACNKASSKSLLSGFELVLAKYVKRLSIE